MEPGTRMNSDDVPEQVVDEFVRTMVVFVNAVMAVLKMREFEKFIGELIISSSTFEQYPTLVDKLSPVEAVCNAVLLIRLTKMSLKFVLTETAKKFDTRRIQETTLTVIALIPRVGKPPSDKMLDMVKLQLLYEALTLRSTPPEFNACKDKPTATGPITVHAERLKIALVVDRTFDCQNANIVVFVATTSKLSSIPLLFTKKHLAVSRQVRELDKTDTTVLLVKLTKDMRSSTLRAEMSEFVIDRTRPIRDCTSWKVNAAIAPVPMMDVESTRSVALETSAAGVRSNTGCSESEGKLLVDKATRKFVTEPPEAFTEITGKTEALIVLRSMLMIELTRAAHVIPMSELTAVMFVTCSEKLETFAAVEMVTIRPCPAVEDSTAIVRLELELSRILPDTVLEVM